RDAIRHELRACRIRPAPAALRIEQAARDIGVMDLAGIGVLELVQAAAPAAVAERLPFLVRHLGKRLRFPEACREHLDPLRNGPRMRSDPGSVQAMLSSGRSEEHTSVLQSRENLVCR